MDPIARIPSERNNQKREDWNEEERMIILYLWRFFFFARSSFLLELQNSDREFDLTGVVEDV